MTWVDTRVPVQAGQPLRVSATGSWTPSAGNAPATGPDGYAFESPDNFLNLTDLGVCPTCPTTPTGHYAALIGYIGDAPPAAGSYTSSDILPEARKVFVVGSDFAGPAPGTGRLWLAFNTDAYSADVTNHLGQATATVTVEA